MSVISDNVDAASRSALALFRVGAHQIAAAAAMTAAPCVITWSTDNPSFTANGAQLIADGDAVTAVEALHGLLEVQAMQDALAVDMSDARVALNALLASGASQGDTANITTNTLFSAGVVWSFTTDAAAFTANNAVTIADGDATTSTTTRGEMLEAARELNAQNVIALADLTQMVKRINALVGGGSEIYTYGACPALVASATPLAITWTTDNPSITGNSVITIADGDAPTAAELRELMVELKLQATATQVDAAVVRTKLVAALKQVGIV